MNYLEIVKKIGFEIPSEEYREVLEQPDFLMKRKKEVTTNDYF